MLFCIGENIDNIRHMPLTNTSTTHIVTGYALSTTALTGPSSDNGDAN